MSTRWSYRSSLLNASTYIFLPGVQFLAHFKTSPLELDDVYYDDDECFMHNLN